MIFNLLQINFSHVVDISHQWTVYLQRCFDILGVVTFSVGFTLPQEFSAGEHFPVLENEQSGM